MTEPTPRPASHEAAFAAACALRRSADEQDQLAARHGKMSKDEGYTDATRAWAERAQQDATDLAAELRRLAREILKIAP